MVADELAVAPITEVEWKNMSELMGELRKIQRDDLFVPVARLQLHYALNQIKRTDKNDENELNRLRKFARGVAYNIAAFTWPGWDDMGPIASKDQELGLSAARVALNFATQTEDITFNALWINGAHELNAKNFDSAIEFFEQARDKADELSGKKMASGWIALTKFLDDATQKKQASLEDAVAELRQADEKNGDFFAQQIETALTVYTRDE
ncbi:MAG: hypothetical protein F4W92_10200 [Gammaproteobacteria bacterium]|nr:hypothetical protein [Gammaproteobacteria bacterium]